MNTALSSLWSPSEFPVKLAMFEGPLDLLIFLIRKNEIDIYDIPMEVVTTQYIEFLDGMEKLNLEVAGEFFVMASTLMYIKSRMLLPPREQPPDETEDDSADPRWELVQQLLEYRRFKTLAGHIEDRIDSRAQLLDRIVKADEQSLDLRPLESIDRLDLWNAINQVFLRLADKMRVGEILDEPVTVAERMEHILAHMNRCDRFLFSELIDAADTLIVLVTTFLALLELTRLRKLRLSQEDSFGDIICEVRKEHPPLPQGEL